MRTIFLFFLALLISCGQASTFNPREDLDITKVDTVQNETVSDTIISSEPETNIYSEIDSLMTKDYLFITLEKDCPSYSDSCEIGDFVIESNNNGQSDTLRHIMLSSLYGKTLKYISMSFDKDTFMMKYTQGSADRCNVYFSYKEINGEFFLSKISFLCNDPNSKEFVHNMTNKNISIYDIELQVLCDSLYPDL